MKVLHTSDLHGNWRMPVNYFRDFDVWVDTGDFLPNISRGESIEKRWQTDWFTMKSDALARRYKPWIRERYAGSAWGTSGWFPSRSRQPPQESYPSVGAALVDWLEGRPVICVSGNHDFADLASLLRAAGHRNVANVQHAASEVGSLRFAGFREIPYIEGEWAGEADEATIRSVIERTMARNPDVLLTHCPPAGILDASGMLGSEGHIGISPLTTWLSYRPHSVAYHLFGHVHERAGVREEMGIFFSNAATTGRILFVGE